MPQYVLFDNSALNYISGQHQHGSQLGEADRKALVDVVRPWLPPMPSLS